MNGSKKVDRYTCICMYIMDLPSCDSVSPPLFFHFIVPQVEVRFNMHANLVWVGLSYLLSFICPLFVLYLFFSSEEMWRGKGEEQEVI